MLILGLTGGIGSGKTTVAKIFQSFGVPIYNSDERAKHILFSNESVHQELMSIFGKEVFTDNKPDKVKLASVVFSDEKKLKQLNTIIHPLVAQDFDLWLKEQTSNIVIKEAAILIESGAYKTVDKICVVSAPKEVRVNRVMARDNSSKEEVLKRINNQLSDEERLTYADFVINNSGEHHLITQVQEILKQLM